jgi:hypothetical protein
MPGGKMGRTAVPVLGMVLAVALEVGPFILIGAD